MTVKNTKEAWAEADKLFPCDYMEDAGRSSRAGYPIYFSTCPDVYAWISDLGDRLEVNLPDGRSVNIWIESQPEVLPVFDVEAVQVSDDVYAVPVETDAGEKKEVRVSFNVETADGTVWEYRIDGQFFSRTEWAARYLFQRMQELKTGVRYLPRRHGVPVICGVDGCGCRNKRGNSALCNNCPIAEKIQADRDGVKIVYLQ